MQFFIPKCARRLLEHIERHHAFIHEQPEVVQVAKQVEPALLAFDEELKSAKIDLSKTFDDRFIKKAAGG